ncbi:MAG: hypothetical protein KGL39_14680 [Patescibacteria group bacterium]|nr:hypothetical protein [Patescibacteria group bacterium]
MSNGPWSVAACERQQRRRARERAEREAEQEEDARRRLARQLEAIVRKWERRLNERI